MWENSIWILVKLKLKSNVNGGFKVIYCLHYRLRIADLNDMVLNKKNSSSVVSTDLHCISICLCYWKMLTRSYFTFQWYWYTPSNKSSRAIRWFIEKAVLLAIGAVYKNKAPTATNFNFSRGNSKIQQSDD